MAIDRGTARLLLSELAKRPFRGSILQLGRQTILFDERQLRAWAEHSGTRLESGVEDAERKELKSRTGPACELTDSEFFRLLGFDEVASCDVSAYEGATLVVDLNQPIPPELHDRFDVVFNCGTMEHVFDVPTVLSNIHSLLKVGGRAIHIAPTSNMVDHGFYCFSPTFFGDYYRVNRYLVRSLYLFECVSWTGKWTVYDCLAGSLDNRLGRIANAKMAGLFCVAEKIALSTSDVIPAQSHFSRLWEHASSSNPSGVGRLKRTISGDYPDLANMIFWIRSLAWRICAIRRAALPPLVGKY
jgi:SAM-dependent methyltransferase